MLEIEEGEKQFFHCRFLLAAAHNLRRDQPSSACRHITVASHWLAINEYSRITGCDFGDATMPLLWAGHLVAYTRYPLAVGVRRRGSRDDFAAVVSCVSRHDKRSRHDYHCQISKTAWMITRMMSKLQ